MAWQFIVLLGLLASTILGWGLANTRPFWVGMLAISTLLFMVASEAFLVQENFINAVNGPCLSRSRTAAAGAIMSVASSVFLMLAVGTISGRKDRTKEHDVVETGAVGTGTARVVTTGPATAYTVPAGEGVTAV
jgi:hypothetical protein